jgi:hypothetical protein
VNTQFVTKSLNLPSYWKMAVIRCAIYAAISGGQTYLAGVEGYQDLVDMTGLAKQKLALNVFLAVISTWGAFIDQTITKMGGDAVTPEKIKSVLADMNKAS